LWFKTSRGIGADRLSRCDDISIGNLWRVQGNVTNRSSHELSGFT
jgi:hypothetical protein